MASPRASYETPQPWEERQGTLVDRVVRVSAEARRIYAQQDALLPTIQHEHTLDPAIGDHLADVGKRIQILNEHARTPDKKALAVAAKQSSDKRVIPSRFPEEGDDDENDDDGDDNAFLRGRIETMLLDQEWDTRSWNSAKIRVAVETLYNEIEKSDDAQRRALATTMLIRLLETHESAVDVVEVTIPILMNTAFQSLSKMVDLTRVYRVCTLLSVLAEWFAPILSRENAMAKSMAFLLRETELCARIVQHHWRGVLLERSLMTRLDIDASVRRRLRAMHWIQNVELHHQFTVLRDVVGPMGLPLDALQAYVKILYHLVRPMSTAVDKNRRHDATADQKRLLNSGLLVVLASHIPTDMTNVPLDQRNARRAIAEHAKGIALALTQGFGHDPNKIVAILQSNIIQRVTADIVQHLSMPSLDVVRTSLDVVAAVTNAVWQLVQHPDDSREALFLQHRVRATAVQFLTTPQVLETLLLVLPIARTSSDAALCVLVLSTLQSLSGSIGFRPLLDALTRNGGRALQQVILCFDWDASPHVVHAAVALFHDMTNHSDARAGFTTAGAVLLLSAWCTGNLTTTKNKVRFVLALCGIALLARQKSPPPNASSGNILDSLGTLDARLDALYAILLELVSGASREMRTTALYLHETTNVFQPILLPFLVQVSPSDMEPQFQTRQHRSISCIVLGRFLHVPAVAAAAFSEATVVHIALSLQCSRLDEVEGKMRRSISSERDRRLHFLGLKEACKALSRFARCPSGPAVNLTLRPTITSGNVPQLPQAIVCDVVMRLHVLEDVFPLIHVPTDAAEFGDIDTAMAHAAIELVGYLRPMPYGEIARRNFLSATASHPHGKFAHEKLELLVALGAPMILHVLKEKACGSELVATCCAALSRLAATNTCRSLLLKQGALFIALTHVPEVLFDATQSPVKNMDAHVDDTGLLDVPASLFTLLGKLCAIADGRTAILKAQALPRVLKRLQLTDTKHREHDLDVKSEIAGLVRRLAMCNAAEGNTSELFLHFRVLELLADLIETPAKRSWRVLDNVVGAIAALAQDVLVCVPTIVQFDMMTTLAPLLLPPDKTSRESDTPLAHHIMAAQYHVVHVAYAIATYPFGEYHAYLERVSSADPLSPTGARLVIERLQKIAFDFTLELQPKGETEQPTIGELAREILALMREHEMSRQARAKKASVLPTATSPSRSRPTSPHILTSSRGSLSPAKSEQFPVLRSPTRDCGRSPLASRPSETPSKGETMRLPSASPRTTGITTAGSISLGLDLLSTRPSPKPAQPVRVEEPPFIFARPKEKQRKHKSRRKDENEQFLMLDPLFQPTSPLTNPRRRKDNRILVDDVGGQREEDGFLYYQQIAREGHHVSLRARRSRAGDKYIPSLGQLVVEDPTMNVLGRR